MQEAKKAYDTIQELVSIIELIGEQEEPVSDTLRNWPAKRKNALVAARWILAAGDKDYGCLERSDLEEKFGIHPDDEKRLHDYVFSYNEAMEYHADVEAWKRENL